MHTSAISHFSSEQRVEIRQMLGAASVRRVGEVMMGKCRASNAVYNAAANLTTAVLGGPCSPSRKAFETGIPRSSRVSVRRYMLRDWEDPGDNEAPAAALGRPGPAAGRPGAHPHRRRDHARDSGRHD